MPRIDIESYEDDWDDLEPPRAPRARDLSVEARRRMDDLESARVVAVDRGRVTVLHRDAVVEAVFAGTMRGTRVAVGDLVSVRPPRHESDPPRIVELRPRTTVLSRTGDDAVDDERVVVANVDQVVVVLAADHLTVGARLLDRVMVAASAGGLDTVVCVNKRDLVGDLAQVDDLRRRYGDLGVRSAVTCALSGEGVDDLRGILSGRWSAFTGHSGVGKSSLLNVLAPGADHEVGEVGRRGGRHTTVAARAVRLDDDSWIVDTPGVRSFGLGLVDPSELARHFPELASLDCALSDCIHVSEPGCALDVRAVHPERLASYRRLLAALRDPAGHDPDA